MASNEYNQKEHEYDKRKLEKLERFERAVRGLVEVLDTSIVWIWVLLLIGIPVLLYFQPLIVSGTIQAIIAFCFIAFMFIISIIWRKVSRADALT